MQWSTTSQSVEGNVNSSKVDSNQIVDKFYAFNIAILILRVVPGIHVKTLENLNVKLKVNNFDSNKFVEILTKTGLEEFCSS